MNWDALGAIAEAIGGLGVILTLGYLSLQIRGSNRVASAQARQSMSDFSMHIATFRAEHADRYARLDTLEELTPADREFRYWSHMQMVTYGEAYYHQFQLGLMPESHWRGFSNWMDEYVTSKGFDAFWASDDTSFSEDYSAWIDERLKKHEQAARAGN